MQGAFDAIAIAPYFSPSGTQRAGYTTATTVDQVIADTRAAIDGSVAQVNAHQAIADTWSTRLGRDIKLLAYEGGHHLDGRSAPYQNVFYAAAANGSMWNGVVPPPQPVTPATFTISVPDVAAAESGRDPGVIRLTRSGGNLAATLVVAYAVGGTAIGGADYSPRPGQVVFTPGQTSRTITVPVIADTAVEADETFTVRLAQPQNATLAASFATGTSRNDDVVPTTVTVVRDIPCAVVDGRTLLLDAYRPAGAGPFPAVVLVHGGGFTSGSKGGYTGDLARSLAAAGYAVFDINYRLLGDLGPGATLDGAMNAAREDRGHTLSLDQVVAGRTIRESVREFLDRTMR